MNRTHPTLYKLYLTYAVLSIEMGLNFVFLSPAFMPLSLHKWYIGGLFLTDGLVKLFLLDQVKSNAILRLSMAASVALYSFWATALTYDFFNRHLTSLQLPLFVIGLAVIGLWLLFEPMVNPATATEERPDASR